MVEIKTAEGAARAGLAWPDGGSPGFLLVLTHGAGGDPDTADVRAVAEVALRLGGAVALVTQPYRVRGQRVPGSPARQDAAWAEVIAALRKRVAARLRRSATAGSSGQARAAGGRGSPGSRPRMAEIPLIQGGRSNGARVACRTAQAVGASAVIALAFPLHPPGRPENSRVHELRGAGVDVLVVNGERDPFGIPDPAGAAKVVVLPGETHSLSRHPEEVARAVESWLREELANVGGGDAGSAAPAQGG